MVDRYANNENLRRYSITSTNTPSSVSENEDDDNNDIDTVSFGSLEDDLDDRAGENATQVELSLECDDLANMDLLSLSDAFCVAYLDRGPGGLFELGRTETVWNNLNPQFVRSFLVEHDAEMGHTQKIKFKVYDRDSNSERLEKHDFIGSAETTLDDLRDAPAHRLRMKLVNPSFTRSKEPGYLSVCAEKVNLCDPRALIEFKISTKKLRKRSINTVASQFFEVQRAREESDRSIAYNPVFRSEAISKDGDDKSDMLRHKHALITVQKLNNGQMDRPLKFIFYRYKRSGHHQLIGYFVTTLNKLKGLDPKRKPSSCILPLQRSPDDDGSFGSVILTKKHVDRHRTSFELNIDHSMDTKLTPITIDAVSKSTRNRLPEESPWNSRSQDLFDSDSLPLSNKPSKRISRRLSNARVRLSNLSIRR